MTTLTHRTFELDAAELILGNSNKRFSGVTSTLLQVFPHQLKYMNTVIMGHHHIPNQDYCISFWQACKICRRRLPNGKYRIFHARRNNEMIQALILKYVFFAKIKIAFTSTAQRTHSKFTRFLISRMDSIVTTSVRAGSFLKKDADIIIPHGVQTEIFSPVHNKSDSLTSIGIQQNRGIGIFGRVRPQKGTHIFVHACLALFKTRKDLAAVICGGHSNKDRKFIDTLKNEIARENMQDQFYFLGEQPFLKVAQIMASMELVCALSSHEGYGLTVPEALSCGVRVICTHAGAWPEIVRPGLDGNILHQRNVDDLKLLLEQALDPDKKVSTEQPELSQMRRARICKELDVETEARRLCRHFMTLM